MPKEELQVEAQLIRSTILATHKLVTQGFDKNSIKFITRNTRGDDRSTLLATSVPPTPRTDKRYRRTDRAPYGGG